MKMLEVQSSVRPSGSISRQLSYEFVQAWQKYHPHNDWKIRDVGINPPPHPTALWTQANYTPPEMRSPEMITALADSEVLIEELLWADRLLLGVPMYNFSVPSTLKAYIDNIVRINRTFTFEPTTYRFTGLATGKKALIITPSAGNFVVGTQLGTMNFCDTYLRSLLNFIGIEDITVVPIPDQFISTPIRVAQRVRIGKYPDKSSFQPCYSPLSNASAITYLLGQRLHSAAADNLNDRRRDFKLSAAMRLLYCVFSCGS
jgi:FMN-dependent NADH-azoreductase